MVCTRSNWLILVCVSVGSVSSFVSLEGKARNTAQNGHNAMLECAVKITDDVNNLQISQVIWHKAKKSLVSYIEGKTKAEARFQFAEPSWNKNMNLSLLITNTRLTDAGDYECIVLTSSGAVTMRTTLDITAKYNKPAIQSNPTKLKRDMDFNLRCQSDAGYPQGQLRWFDKAGADWTKSSEMNVTQTEDGLFILSSELSVLRGSVSDEYTCAVYNATGGREEEAPFDVYTQLTESVKGDEATRPAVGVVAPLVVVGSLIVGLLLLILMLYQRKRRQDRRNSTAPLMGDNRLDYRERSSVEEEGEMDQFSTRSELREVAE